MSQRSTVARVLYVNLALSVLIGLLILLFRNTILDYQLTHVPGQKRDELSVQLWIRPAVVLLIAFVYVRLVARLEKRRKRTYIRLLVIGILGALGAAYLAIAPIYPWWLRGLEIVQFFVLATMTALVLRPSFRSLFFPGARGGVDTA